MGATSTGCVGDEVDGPTSGVLTWPGHYSGTAIRARHSQLAYGWSIAVSLGRKRLDDGESACRRDSVQPLRAWVAIHLSGLPGEASLSRSRRAA
jgi:hypothetical protein